MMGVPMIRPDEPYLTFAGIAREWARERGVHRHEAFAELLRAFWRGEFEAKCMAGPKVMEARDQVQHVGCPPGPVQKLRVSTEEDPELDEDGYAVRPYGFELVDCGRCRLFDWLEGLVPADLTPVRARLNMDCAAGPGLFLEPYRWWSKGHVLDVVPSVNERDFQLPAGAPLSRWAEPQCRLVLTGVLHRITVGREDFARWVRTVGWSLPRFWFPDGRGPDDPADDQLAVVAAEPPDSRQPAVATSDDRSAGGATGRQRPAEADPYRNPAGGRRSAKRVILQEVERRIKANEAHQLVTHEAKHLVEWLKIAHPNAPSPNWRTVEQSIREAHRVWRSKTAT